MQRHIKYNYEYEKKLNVGFIGCGGHAYRNIYPCFAYLPVNLVAVCDLDINKADSFKRLFGAERAYDDYKQMLEKEQLDAVFVVVGYDGDCRPLYPPIAIDCMKAGCDVWIEKPPASSSEEILEMQNTERETGRRTAVGIKKSFFPAIEKTKEIIMSDGFGEPSSMYIRYPQGLPFDVKDRQSNEQMVGFLDHLVHPASIVNYLMGDISSMYFSINEQTGSSCTVFNFASGAVGTMHLCAGISGTAPLERLEVVGNGANVVVDNGVNLTYYRRGDRSCESTRNLWSYGRISTFIGEDDCAPITWSPEFSLGQLYNKNIFMLGYVEELLYFCEAVMSGERLEKGNLSDALKLTRLYEAYKKPANTIITF